MLGNYLIAIGAIMTLMAAWIGVQHLTRWYSSRHPEFGPHREDGGDCGAGGCSHCSGADHCGRA